MSHPCRPSTALALLLLLLTATSGGAAPVEPATIAEVVVEDVESAPADVPAVDHLVKVERVLQGSVPGTSLIVRVPAAQRSPALQPGERAILSLAPAQDGSFQLLHVERESLGGTPGAEPTLVAAVTAPDDRANPAAATFGTFGRGDEGWMAAEKIVTGIFEGNGFVSTLAALNLREIGGNVTVVLRDAEGELVGLPVSLFFGSHRLRILPLSGMFPDVVSRRGPFTVELVSNDIFFSASTILLEIESKDQIFIPATPLDTGGTASAGEVFFPRVVHTRSPFDISLTSRLVAFNPAGEGRLLTLEFWERGQDNTAPRTAYRYVEPGRSLRVDDILPDLFGLDEGIGALRVTWSGPAGPAPRIVSLMFAATAGGQGMRFGTLVDAVTEADAVRSRGIDAGARQTTVSRSSFGLINLAPASTSLLLTLKDAAGRLLATAQVGLKPRQHLERNLAGLFPGIGNGEGWIIETGVLSGGPVLTYLTHIDAGGDISYTPGRAR